MTEVITAAVPEFTAANVAEVGGRLAVSLVLREKSETTQERVLVSLWTERASGGGSWTARFQHPVTLPLLEQMTYYNLATRVGQVDGHILVSVGNVSKLVKFLGCWRDSCFFSEQSAGKTVWLIADPAQSQPRVEAAATGPWTQVLNRDGRTFIVKREVTRDTFGGLSLREPNLQAFPRTFQWEAADGPRILVIVRGGGLSGFGVPRLPDGSARSYRVLRTAALVPPAWKPVGLVVPGEDGSFGFIDATAGEPQGYYRAEEQPFGVGFTRDQAPVGRGSNAVQSPTVPTTTRDLRPAFKAGP